MVTPKLMVGFGNSTMSEILCMSSLFAYLMKIHPKMKALWCPQHFPHYFLLSMASYSEESKILCLSWLPKSLTKIQSKHESAISCQQHFIRHSRASKSKVYGLI